MPPIKLSKVVSVSSEDTVHSAANLLKGEFNNLKWKSKNCGEKQISVVFQFDEPSKIVSVDVGNENSAFIEILVSKSSENDDKYKVLLAASSLMSLREAKNSENVNGVKFYKIDDLSQESREEKWDRVKIVCTQPYNSIVQFGLSFVVFHTNEVVKNDVPDLGKFRLKDIASVSSMTPITAWGLKAKNLSTELKGAAAVRGDQIKLPSAKKFVTAQAINVTPKVKPHAPVSFTPEVDTDSDNYSPSDEPESEDFNESPDSTPQKQAKPPSKNIKVKNDADNRRTPKRKLDPPGKKPPDKPKVAVSHFKSRPTKPFNRLFEGVFFVISGFQNPLRSDIRNSALAMGAKYKADWDDSCTHLVCAFRNTPKFNQVQGRGKIVTKDWINDCHRLRKRLPWRRYALDPQDSSRPESEEEIVEEVEPGPSIDNRRRLNSSSDEDEVEKQIKRIKRQRENKPAKISPTKGIKTPPSANSKNKITLPYENGKDDKVEINDKADIYDASTEEDSETEQNGRILDDLPVMPAFFDTRHFLILDDLDDDERTKLKRYILARAGQIVSDMDVLSNTDQSYCVTRQKSRADEVTETFPKVRPVLPDWIWLCHDENQIQDEKPYYL